MKFKALVAAVACSNLISGCIHMGIAYYQSLSLFSDKYSYNVNIQKERLTAYELNIVFAKTKGSGEEKLILKIRKKLDDIADERCIKQRLSSYLDEPSFSRFLYEEPGAINDIATSCMIDLILKKEALYPEYLNY